MKLLGVAAVAVYALVPMLVRMLVPPIQDRPAAPPPPREAAERGALAVLRRDGILFPLASFNRDAWRVTWLRGARNVTEVPMTLRDIPDDWWGTRTPEMWVAFLASGEVRPIELRAPVQFRTFCTRRLGISTTYRSAAELPPTPGDPFPKDGIAVSGYARIESIEAVRDTAAEWKPLESSLVDAFERVERTTIIGVRNNSGWRHPLNDKERSKAPLRLESWYRSPGDEPGSTVSYVEVVRKYPPRAEDKGCGLETLVSGWLYHVNGELKESGQLGGKIMYCDRVGATYMLPFGRIRPREHGYWIYQISGYEEEWYEVVRIDRGNVRQVVVVPAGNRLACP